MDGATVGVGPVSRAKILGIGPRFMLTRLGTDIDACDGLHWLVKINKSMAEILSILR